MMRTIIIVQNLKCGGCVNTINLNLSALKNISDVEVNIVDSVVFFQAVAEEDAYKVKEKLKSLGYPSTEYSNSFTSKAKSFVSCATGKLSEKIIE